LVRAISDAADAGLSPEMVSLLAGGRVAPLRMTDGRDASYVDWSSGYNPDTWLDRAIQATRDVAYPYNGLDPHM